METSSVQFYPLGINADELDIKDESLVNIAYSRYMLS